MTNLYTSDVFCNSLAGGRASEETAGRTVGVEYVLCGAAALTDRSHPVSAGENLGRILIVDVEFERR
jgi:hypothetical protein